jgi:secondary thiamine-phosphate synthase enzyme
MNSSPRPSTPIPAACHQEVLTVATRGMGLHELTAELTSAVARAAIGPGLVHIFCQHTSCSLVIMENADATARRDLERWLNRLVPADDPDFAHTAEGPDDMPSHIKMALTRTSETIPLDAHGDLLLGTWQGLYLWEHRAAPHTRRLVVTVSGPLLA